MPPEEADGSSQRHDNDPEPNEPRPDSTGGLPALKRLFGRTGVFERYKLEGEIARGGMGAILRVWDEDLQRHLAMKVVLGQGEAAASGRTPPVDARRLARFLEEAQVTSQLDHPGIVPVHELGLDAKGCVYFTMKLVKGKTLKEVFDELAAGEGGLRAYATTGDQVLWTRARVLGLIQKMCEAMAYAHHKGVIHRDLKPANVMVGRFGEVYVMDWGLARVLDKPDPKDLRIRQALMTSELRSERREISAETPDSPLVTMDGDVVGTPSFMSPEQAAGRASEMGPPSDVYAIGAMLYQMLSGQMPYVPYGARLNNYAIWQRVQEGPPVPLSQLAPKAPPELVAICEKAMARKPEDRYPTMEELAEDMAAYVEGRVVHAFESGGWAEARKWVTRNGYLAASLAGALALLIAGTTGIATIQAAGKSAASIQREIAQRNEAIAKEERDRADAKAAEAEQKTREARWQMYLAETRSALAALELVEIDDARGALDAAPPEFRGWEWDYLDARTEPRVAFEGFADNSSIRSDGSRSLPVPPQARVAFRSAVPSAFSADGTKLISALVSPGPWGIKGVFPRDHEEPMIQVRDVASGEELMAFHGLWGGIADVALSPDGSRLVAVSRNGALRLWDAVTGTLLESRSSPFASTASFSPDGSRILVGGSSLSILDSRSCAEKAALLVPSRPATSKEAKFGWTKVPLYGVDRPTFSPDGEYVVSRTGGKARIWQASTLTEVQALGDDRERFVCAVFGPDGTQVLTAQGSTAIVWDWRSGADLRTLVAPSAITRAAWSPDGTRILVMSEDGTARLFDARTGSRTSEFRGHASAVVSVSFHPSGSRIVIASRDETARIWDPGTGAELLVFGADDEITSASFSREGSRLLATCGNGTVLLWDSMRSLRRYKEWSETSSVVPGARDVVTRVLENESDWSAAADRIRSDPRLDLNTRRASLDELSRQSLLVQEEAWDWTRELFLADPLMEGCSERIANERARSAAVRQAALKYVESAQDPWRLNELAWSLVERPDSADVPSLERAVLMAARAFELSPFDPDIRNTLGVAQYRAGRYTEAIQTLQFSTSAADRAFLAMAMHRRGEAGEARRLLTELRAASLPAIRPEFLKGSSLFPLQAKDALKWSSPWVSMDPTWDDHARDALVEAEALIGD